MIVTHLISSWVWHMTALYNHLSWFFFLLISLLSRFYFSIFLSFQSQSLVFYFNLFDLNILDISVSFFFDFISSWFFTIVLLISTIIIVYSYNYISPYSKSGYFLWFTILFVLSMLIVISMNNLLFLILGWDGLGLISFFLIVYYQNQSSITSGLFTILMNRIGDSFFLASIMVFMYSSIDLTVFSYHLPDLFSVLLLLITFITKRALFPFSPWLPAAMAAPTPISALVHSSTLVTAGLFLIMRFSYFFYSCVPLINALLVIRIFTSFYAGLNTLFEKDLKKLIALSTLSHLGFIGMAYASGLLYLAFFHMLTHALFKSLLFITIGDIIINMSHSQDIRYLSKGYHYTPFSSFIINVSLLNLLGLPTLRGYFSKDLVLEGLNYSYISSCLYFLVICNVFFTYYYTYTLLYFSFQSNKLSPLSLVHSPLLIHSSLMLLLSFLAVSFGLFFISHVYPYLSFLSVPFSLKFAPLFINVTFFLVLFLLVRMFSSRRVFINSYFSQMMYLTPFILTIMSKFYSSLVYNFNKSFESGLFNYVFNIIPSSFLLSSGSFLFRQSMYNPLQIVLFSFGLVILLSL